MSGRYTIHRTNDCIVIEGRIPVMDLAALMREWEKLEGDGTRWIVDSLLAKQLRCNLVIGPPAACLAWRQKLGIVAPDSPVRPRYRLVDHPHPGIVCGKCARTSYNRNDIEQRYCGNCKTYLDN